MALFYPHTVLSIIFSPIRPFIAILSRNNVLKPHSKYPHKIKKRKPWKSTSETWFVLIGSILVYHTLLKNKWWQKASFLVFNSVSSFLPLLFLLQLIMKIFISFGSGRTRKELTRQESDMLWLAWPDYQTALSKTVCHSLSFRKIRSTSLW